MIRKKLSSGIQPLAKLREGSRALSGFTAVDLTPGGRALRKLQS